MMKIEHASWFVVLLVTGCAMPKTAQRAQDEKATQKNDIYCLARWDAPHSELASFEVSSTTAEIRETSHIDLHAENFVGGLSVDKLRVSADRRWLFAGPANTSVSQPLLGVPLDSAGHLSGNPVVVADGLTDFQLTPEGVLLSATVKYYDHSTGDYTPDEFAITVSSIDFSGSAPVLQPGTKLSLPGCSTEYCQISYAFVGFSASSSGEYLWIDEWSQSGSSESSFRVFPLQLNADLSLTLPKYAPSGYLGYAVSAGDYLAMWHGGWEPGWLQLYSMEETPFALLWSCGTQAGSTNYKVIHPGCSGWPVISENFLFTFQNSVVWSYPITEVGIDSSKAQFSTLAIRPTKVLVGGSGQTMLILEPTSTDDLTYRPITKFASYVVSRSGILIPAPISPVTIDGVWYFGTSP